MSDTEPPEKPQVKSESLWPAVLFWGGVALVLFIAGEIDKETPGAGRSFFGWVVGLCALGVFAWIVWGKTLRSTIGNVATIVKGAVIVIVVSLVLGGLFQCAGIGPGSDRGTTGGVPDQWGRKP